MSGGVARVYFSDNAPVLVLVDTIRLTLTGGTDQDLFQIDTESDGMLSSSKSIAVTVTYVDDNTPLFTSLNEADVAENSQVVIILTATDVDGDPVTREQMATFLTRLYRELV